MESGFQREPILDSEVRAVIPQPNLEDDLQGAQLRNSTFNGISRAQRREERRIERENRRLIGRARSTGTITEYQASVLAKTDPTAANRQLRALCPEIRSRRITDAFDAASSILSNMSGYAFAWGGLSWILHDIPASEGLPVVILSLAMLAVSLGMMKYADYRSDREDVGLGRGVNG